MLGMLANGRKLANTELHKHAPFVAVLSVVKFITNSMKIQLCAHLF